MHVRFTQRTAVPGDSLLAKAPCPVSVVNADRVQADSGGATNLATNRIRREISILWLPTALFGKSICYLGRRYKPRYKPYTKRDKYSMATNGPFR